MTDKPTKILTSRPVAAAAIAIFFFTVLFAHRSAVSYLALAVALYLVLATRYHEKHRPLSWEIVLEYVIGSFILWFVASSMW